MGEVCVRMCAYVLCMYMHACMRVCMHVCMHASLSVHLYVWICNFVYKIIFVDTVKPRFTVTSVIQPPRHYEHPGTDQNYFHNSNV